MLRCKASRCEARIKQLHFALAVGSVPRSGELRFTSLCAPCGRASAFIPLRSASRVAGALVMSSLSRHLGERNEPQCILQSSAYARFLHAGLTPLGRNDIIEPVADAVQSRPMGAPCSAAPRGCSSFRRRKRLLHYVREPMARALVRFCIRRAEWQAPA